jgi:hypothetical protein
VETFVPLIDLLIFLVLLWSARFILGAREAEPWVKNLNAAQTLITIIAVIVAATWYVVEQPHAPKLKIDQTVTGAPGPAGQVMVIAEVSFTNLGSTVINLRGVPMKLFVQQVSPVLPNVAAEAGKTDAKGALIIERGDNWGALAEFTDPLTSFLESGEVENLYYRVIIPCQPGLRVYFTSRFERPGMVTDVFFHVKDFQFRKQTLVDLSGLCAAPEKGSGTNG